WSPGGATTQTLEVSPSETTTYTVTVTNQSGCSKSANHTVTVNPLPQPVGSTTSICAGGKVTLDAGSGFASYSWSPGEGTSQTFEVSPTETTTYTVIVTNQSGCTKSANHTVTVNPLPQPVGSTTSICAGAKVTLDAGSGFANYSWSPGGGTSQTFEVSPTETTTYTVTVTNESGCSKSATHTVTVNPLPQPVGSTTSICAGAKVTLDAGSGFASYSWSPGGATTQTLEVSPSETTTYTVTVTNQSGCSKSANHTVTVNPLPKPEGSSSAICAGGETTLDAGSGFASYSWSPGDATTQSITVSPAATTSYVVTVTNAEGCSATATHRVTVNPLPPAQISAATAVCIDSPNNWANTPDAGQGATYAWTIENGAITSGQPYGRSIVFTAGSDATKPVVLTVTVTNAFGCVKSHTKAVATKACVEGCSLTQGAWGSAGGAGSLGVLTNLIGTGLTVGAPGRMFSVTAEDAACLMLRLPAGGAPSTLSATTIFTSTTSCTTEPNLIAKNGKFSNVLLGQTITLALNVRGDAGLGDISLCNTMVTQRLIRLGNGTTILDPGSDGLLGTLDDPIRTVTIPQSVITALGSNATVAGLLALANAALGRLPTGGASLSDINKAVDAINVGFDECRIKINCVPVSTLSAPARTLATSETPPELCDGSQIAGTGGGAAEGAIPKSVIEAIRKLELPLRILSLEKLADVFRSGGAIDGVPLADLNRAIEFVNQIVESGSTSIPCEQ
ncbi:MAG TPA: hypothetical protein VNL91_00375, partial [Thermoanaerobaculia bacterium]|nr:hypothetical protein [Thermoanaerobaculia bacterium]